MAMEGDWAARAGACASARDPADSMVKHTAAQSTTIASGKEDRALFWRRANGIRHPFRRSAALTLPPPSPSLRAKLFFARRQGADMAIQRPMERGKAVPRRAVFGMISAMEAIGLTRDLPIAGAQERAEEAGPSNTPTPFAGFLSTHEIVCPDIRSALYD